VKYICQKVRQSGKLAIQSVRIKKFLLTKSKNGLVTLLTDAECGSIN